MGFGDGVHGVGVRGMVGWGMAVAWVGVGGGAGFVGGEVVEAAFEEVVVGAGEGEVLVRVDC